MIEVEDDKGIVVFDEDKVLGFSTAKKPHGAPANIRIVLEGNEIILDFTSHERWKKWIKVLKCEIRLNEQGRKSL